MIGRRCLTILNMSTSKVYWTSRLVNHELKSGWIYKYNYVESKVYTSKAEAESALLLKVILRKP